MSTILLCQDILLEVFGYLSPTRHCPFIIDDEATRTHRSECRHTLIACATVSKSISHHALNTLWASLEGLHPILQLLPEYRRRHSSEYSTISGAISPEAWSRLQSYASRVRYLTVPRKTSIHPSVWSFLARRCAGAPLFPRLLELEADNIAERHIGLLLLVLCPSLREVSVSLKSGSTASATLPDILGSFLDELALAVPHLEGLSLFGDYALEREHLLYLERFTSMVEMGLSDSFILDEAVLQAISTIPTLQVLTGGTIRLGNGEKLDFRDGFCALDNLTVKGTCKDLTNVIVAISKPKFNSLSLDFTDSDVEFTEIATHLPDTIMQYLCTFCAPLSPLPTTLVDLIRPLLSKMPKLDDLGLYAEKSSLSATNDDLVRMADAWPHLTRLHIRHWTSPRSNTRRPSVTVSGLAELARRCPELELISLPELDVGKAAEPRAVPFLDHRLKELIFVNVSMAPASALHEAAVAINTMFPHLDLHEMQPRAIPPASRVNPQWAHIWRTLEIMRWGRESYILSQSGCESTVPEVPEISFDRDDRDDR